MLRAYQKGSIHELPFRRQDGHLSTRRWSHHSRRWSSKHVVVVLVLAACGFVLFVRSLSGSKGKSPPSPSSSSPTPTPTPSPSPLPPSPPANSSLPYLSHPPPLYTNYHRYELQLPQNNLDLPYPEGKHGRYVWVANHAVGVSVCNRASLLHPALTTGTGSGWGNIMQEQLLHAYLVHRTGRG